MTTQNRGTFQVTTPTDREIVITRVFDASPQLLFDALTKPELVKQWLLGPEGWTMPVCEIDLRVGGTYRYIWRHEKKGDMGISGVFREIVPPELLVNTEKFDNPWYEGESLITQVLIVQGKRTTLKLTMSYESREIRDGVLKSGMESGVAVSYDRLEDLLAKG